MIFENIKAIIYTKMLQKLVNLKKMQYPWYPGTSPCRDVVIFKVPKITNKFIYFREKKFILTAYDIM